MSAGLCVQIQGHQRHTKNSPSLGFSPVFGLKDMIYQAGVTCMSDCLAISLNHAWTHALITKITPDLS